MCARAPFQLLSSCATLLVGASGPPLLGQTAQPAVAWELSNGLSSAQVGTLQIAQLLWPLPPDSSALKVVVAPGSQDPGLPATTPAAQESLSGL